MLSGYLGFYFAILPYFAFKNQQTNEHRKISSLLIICLRVFHRM
jgi:hypothetical protein